MSHTGETGQAICFIVRDASGQEALPRLARDAAVAGYGATTLRTPEAFYDQSLGQFILPYDAVSEAPDPEAKLLGFLQETYEAAADLGQRDRKALERVAE